MSQTWRAQYHLALPYSTNFLWPYIASPGKFAAKVQIMRFRLTGLEAWQVPVQNKINSLHLPSPRYVRPEDIDKVCVLERNTSERVRISGRKRTGPRLRCRRNFCLS